MSKWHLFRNEEVLCFFFSIWKKKTSKDWRSRRQHIFKLSTMVGIFSKFSVGRNCHRRTQSAIVSSPSFIYLSYSSTSFMWLLKVKLYGYMRWLFSEFCAWALCSKWLLLSMKLSPVDLFFLLIKLFFKIFLLFFCSDLLEMPST